MRVNGQLFVVFALQRINIFEFLFEKGGKRLAYEEALHDAVDEALLIVFVTHLTRDVDAAVDVDVVVQQRAFS